MTQRGATRRLLWGGERVGCCAEEEEVVVAVVVFAVMLEVVEAMQMQILAVISVLLWHARARCRTHACAPLGSLVQVPS